MPRYRTNFTLAPPRSRLPAGFLDARDLFRARDFDLYAESSIRFVARAGGEVVATFRSIAHARAWLMATPAESQGRRPGRAR